jgi:hypothetical protein
MCLIFGRGNLEADLEKGGFGNKNNCRSFNIWKGKLEPDLEKGSLGNTNRFLFFQGADLWKGNSKANLEKDSLGNPDKSFVLSRC